LSQSNGICNCPGKVVFPFLPEHAINVMSYLLLLYLVIFILVRGMNIFEDVFFRFGLVGHFGLLKNVNITFFLSS
jgi:hypothetical protein